MEGALLELRGLSRSKMWERMNEIVKAIDPADFPAAFGLVGKVSQEMQASVRSAIIARWAEADPRAAMEAANGLKNFNERHQSILAVLRGWAKEDPQGAAAWVEQLPPGRKTRTTPAEPD